MVRFVVLDEVSGGSVVVGYTFALRVVFFVTYLRVVDSVDSEGCLCEADKVFVYMEHSGWVDVFAVVHTAFDPWGVGVHHLHYIFL